MGTLQGLLDAANRNYQDMLTANAAVTSTVMDLKDQLRATQGELAAAQQDRYNLDQQVKRLALQQLSRLASVSAPFAH